MNVLQRAELATEDPILGISEAFALDERPEKVNLGIGVYLDDSGRLPLMEAVRLAQEEYIRSGKSHGYLPIEGLADYRDAVRKLVLPQEALERVATLQTLGGTGALKVGADLLMQLNPGAEVLIPDPSWENHQALFGRAGFSIAQYPYYDAENRTVAFDAMVNKLEESAPDTIVLLHACCHNPTGYDLTDQQWDRVVQVVVDRGLFPFVDMAYQGFGEGLVTDGALIGKLIASGHPFLLSTSYSKNFGLYGQRTGALHAVTANADEAKRVLSQLKLCARTNYSSPPTFGATVVAAVLSDEHLKRVWEEELEQMRTRIGQLRRQLVSGLAEQGIADMGFIAEQRGMFSYSGLSVEQMIRLREEFGVYGTDAGRLCISGLNSNNLDRVVAAIAMVLS